RWSHPRRGMVAPVEFIPLAEQTGLIKGLTEWVLGEALRQLSEWRKRGLEITVSVNLSARNLTDEALPNTIATLLRGYGVPASALVVEVTESAIMTDQRACLKMLRAIHELGVGIAIDDFGVGHS